MQENQANKKFFGNSPASAWQAVGYGKHAILFTAPGNFAERREVMALPPHFERARPFPPQRPAGRVLLAEESGTRRENSRLGTMIAALHTG